MPNDVKAYVSAVSLADLVGLQKIKDNSTTIRCAAA